MVAKLNANPTAAHFVRNGGSGAGTEEGVENKVAGVGSDVKYAVNESLGFRCVKGMSLTKQ